MSNLSSHQPYEGPNDIQIGDGSGLQITHTGSVSLSPFNLSNVLCVTSIKQTLISVSKFCKSNQTSIEFFPTYFVLQHLCTEKPLLSGKNWYDLYEWPTTKGVHTSLAMTFSTNVTAISGNLASMSWSSNPQNNEISYSIWFCVAFFFHFSKFYVSVLFV